MMTIATHKSSIHLVYSSTTSSTSTVPLTIASAILRIIANINHSIQGAAAPSRTATVFRHTAVICSHTVRSTVFWILMSNLIRSKVFLVSH